MKEDPLNQLIDRFLTLLKEDKELHDAVLDLIDARAEAKRAYSVWRLHKIHLEALREQKLHG